MAEKKEKAEVREVKAVAVISERKGPRYALTSTTEVYWGELSEDEKAEIRKQYPAYKDVK